MRAVRKSFFRMLSFVSKDKMLFAASLAPILAGVLFKFGIPKLEILLTGTFKKQAVLATYYGIFDALYAILISVLFCFVAAMVVLEERDEHTANYLRITPLGKSGYLMSRIVIPAGVAFILTLVFLPFFRLTSFSIIFLLLLSCSSACHGVIVALFVIVFSKNKLEGVAMTKLATILMLGILVPYVLPLSIQWIFGFLPAYWIGKAVKSQNSLELIIALFVGAIWMIWLYRMQESGNKSEKM